MNYQHALQVAGECLGLATALLSFLGTVRNFMTHVNLLSTDGATKFGKVLDRAALVCEKGKKGLVWVASLPGFASRPASAPDLKVVPLLMLAALSFAGCATTATPANATLAQKFTADAQALHQMATDVQTKCGPQFAPLAPLIASALAVAADPYNALADITAAVSAIPALAQDYKALACVIMTIRDDINAMKPKAGTTAFMQVEMANQVLTLIDTAPADMCVASR